MSLDDIIDSVVAPQGRGKRAAGQVQASYRRDLNPSDVEALWALPEGGLGSVTPPLAKVRATHHALARLLAEGRPNAEAALITGFSPSRVSLLTKDPAMAELIEYYKTQVEQVYLNVHERLATLGIAVTEEIQERLQDTPEDFSIRELVEVAELTLDRSGHGPSSKVAVNHSHLHVTGDQLARIKADVTRSQNGQIRPLAAQGDPGLALGGPVIDGSLAPATAPQGSEGEGDNLPEQSLPRTFPEIS